MNINLIQFLEALKNLLLLEKLPSRERQRVVTMAEYITQLLKYTVSDCSTDDLKEALKLHIRLKYQAGESSREVRNKERKKLYEGIYFVCVEDRIDIKRQFRKPAKTTRILSWLMKMPLDYLVFFLYLLVNTIIYITR